MQYPDLGAKSLEGGFWLQVAILEAEKDVYAAEIDDKLLLKIGPGSFDIDEDDWEEVGSGKRWRIWAKKSAT